MVVAERFTRTAGIVRTVSFDAVHMVGVSTRVSPIVPAPPEEEVIEANHPEPVFAPPVSMATHEMSHVPAVKLTEVIFSVVAVGKDTGEPLLTVATMRSPIKPAAGAVLVFKPR